MHRTVVSLSVLALSLMGVASPADATNAVRAGLAPDQAASAVAVAAQASSGSQAATSIAVGRVALAFATPSGLPANVVLLGTHRFVVGKAPAGAKATGTLTIPVGTYSVQPQTVNFRGRLFVGTASPSKIVISRGKTVAVKAVYTMAPIAGAMRTTGISTSSVALRWVAAKGAKIQLRRINGSVPVLDLKHGRLVTSAGTAVTDKGLAAGTRYSYSLFTLVGKKWLGPTTLLTGTAGKSGSSVAAFVAAPTTTIIKAGSLDRGTPTGTAVRLQLAAATATPVIGSAVVLPRSATLPGGFLGKVASFSSDGRTVRLAPASLSDAFDYYQVHVAGVTAGTQVMQPASLSAAARGGRVGTRSLASCLLGGATGQSIVFQPSIALGGSFDATVAASKVWGQAVPASAKLTMALTATVVGAADVKTVGQLSCGLPFAPVLFSLTSNPVPISFSFTPLAEFSVGGALEMKNIGFSATAGTGFAVSFGGPVAPTASGAPVLNATLGSPTVVSNGGVSLKVGGDVVVGPGAGSPGAGVIAGVGGTLSPLVATYGPVYASGDPRFGACLKAEATASLALTLVGKAWLGDWPVGKAIAVGALTGEHSYGGPWFLPSGCDQLPAPVPALPGDSVLGTGVMKVSDSMTGLATQFAHLDGFAPGHTAWILTTGKSSDVVGTPDFFASTDLNQPGSAALSALVGGNATYDAVAYTSTVIPLGSQLHVRYVFASEEYPEYVGSAFNDVMAVFVNGTNCATVPGTSDPVSINTINAGQNSSYFVDNATGASGYSTSFDGLTVPLTCTVPVTPGVPVTVQVAVADTNDGIYDAGVALLDQGIWSD